MSLIRRLQVYSIRHKYNFLHPIPMIKAIMRKAPAIGGRRTAAETQPFLGIDCETQTKLGKNYDDAGPPTSLNSYWPAGW
jgi:hypothetical protein